MVPVFYFRLLTGIKLLICSLPTTISINQVTTMTIKLPMMKTATRVLLSAALLTTAAAGVSAKELRLASGLPPLHPAHDPLYTDFQKLLPEYSRSEEHTSELQSR